MSQTSYGCGGMNARNRSLDIALCPPLQQLMEEHIPLWDALDEFHATAERVITEGDTRSHETMELLFEQVQTFEEQLKPHARKEDDVLFPMMARYLGREAGPISVMEYEHEQAEYYLHKFLEEAGGNRSELTADSRSKLAEYAVQAYSILTQHFSKEENVLFPLAENMLTLEEKEQLSERIQSVK